MQPPNSARYGFNGNANAEAMFRNSRSFTNSSSRGGAGGGGFNGESQPSLLPRESGARSRSQSRSRSPLPARRGREGRGRPVDDPASPSRRRVHGNFVPTSPRSPVSFQLPGTKKVPRVPPKEDARNEGGGSDGGGGGGVSVGDGSGLPSALIPPAVVVTGDAAEPSPSSVVGDSNDEEDDATGRPETKDGKGEAEEKEVLDEDGRAVIAATPTATATATAAATAAVIGIGESVPARHDGGGDGGDTVVVAGSGAAEATTAADGRAPAGADAFTTSESISNIAVGSGGGGGNGGGGGGGGGSAGVGLRVHGDNKAEEGLLSARRRRGDQWRHSPAQGSSGGFGHEPYEMGAGSSSGGEDFEAGGGSFSAGDFDINPRGDGSFSTSAARCFKAVIHRIPVARQALPRVHGGFWEAYSKLREKVLAALAAEMQAEYQPLYISGHSLGGALASLAAYDVNKNFSLPDPITLYTFGSPRVGNAAFASKLNSKVKHHFRIVNDGDLVTALPRFFGTYKHAGCKVVVDSERYGNFIVAPTLVEQTFGAKPSASLAPHLLSQYRECLEACMEEADLEDYFSRGIGVDPTLVPEWLKGNRKKDKEDEPALL